MDRVEEIFRADRLIQHFGMKMVEAREGYAKVSVAVEERVLNAHNIGHGGLLFGAAKPGETVFGESRILHKGRQSMVCELTVTSGDGRLLARGQSTALPVSRESFSTPAKKGG